jgi:ABC-type transport system involved in multi-copper enzyme maturation permease subunit
MAWEMRRCVASRLFWFQTLGFFCFLLLITWASRMPKQPGSTNGTDGAFVAGTSAWGLLTNLPLAVLLLGLLLPFVTTDGVTRDLHRRTHELLMTTALPTRAYVCGRYLVALLLGLGLAVLSLAALLGVGWLLHLTTTGYPAPEIGNVLLLWVGMVVPATVLLSSLSFALGTLLPRLSTLIKIVILLAWFMGGVIVPYGLHDITTLPAWYVNWDPTSAVTALRMDPQYSVGFQSHTSTITSAAQMQQILLSVEDKVPDLSGWFAPHLLLAGASLLLVLVAALVFKRSREVLN